MVRSMRGVVATLALSVAAGCGSEAKQEVEPAPAPAKPKVAKAEPKPAPEPEPAPAPPPRPKTPASMDDAAALAKEIHDDRRRTMMCGCRYAKSGRVSPASCGYRTRADEQLAKYVLWSHVVPPIEFGADRECWTKPVCTAEDGSKFRGIECCQQSDEEFATMRTDLHNLVPMVGEVATDRSNYAFGDLKSESRYYGSCDLEIDRDEERIDPAPEIRGDVARTYLYMAETYPGTIQLSVPMRAMFQGWAADDPPDEWEIQRARAIVAVQGIAPSWLTAVPAAEAAPAGDAATAETGDAGESGEVVADAAAPDPAGAVPPDKATPTEAGNAAGTQPAKADAGGAPQPTTVAQDAPKAGDTKAGDTKAGDTKAADGDGQAAG